MSAREMLVWFMLAPKPQTPIPNPEQAKPRKRVHMTLPQIPDYRTLTLPPVAGGPNLNGFHLFLFDCAPENLIKLTAEQRAQCAIASAGMKPNDSVDYADHTNRSRYAAHWARGLARKQQPLLLPCASPEGVGFGLGTLFCLAKGLTDGFDTDNQTGYGDKPVHLHVPNNGDPPNGPPG